MTDLLSRLRELRIIPVIVIERADDAVPLARALVDGGLPCAEVTFRTAAAPEALQRISDQFPDMLLGAGTVLTPDQARQAQNAGAKFIVSPGFNPHVVDHCQADGVPVFPGVCTPTEIEMALSKDLRVVKFFPAEPIGGLPYLKAIAAPYGILDFIPTGGIGLKQLPDYLAFKRIVACGGSWMVSQDWIVKGDFERIRREVENAVDTVRELTGGATP
jgi:2-dehydro-3-deoxyphosphogluconate aldolase / (4S)-4-hydroxy-2-oxoglutarate aldolase